MVCLDTHDDTVITLVQVVMGPDGRAKGFGFVTYEDPKSVDAAIDKVRPACSEKASYLSDSLQIPAYVSCPSISQHSCAHSLLALS